MLPRLGFRFFSFSLVACHLTVKGVVTNLIHFLATSPTVLAHFLGQNLETVTCTLTQSFRCLRASPPMEPTVQPNGHVCTTCGAVTGSPNAEPKLRRSRLKLGLSWTSLAVGLFCGTPVFSQTYCTQSP